jgi:hypothetical protein
MKNKMWWQSEESIVCHLHFEVQALENVHDMLKNYNTNKGSIVKKVRNI